MELFDHGSRTQQTDKYKLPEVGFIPMEGKAQTHREVSSSVRLYLGWAGLFTQSDSGALRRGLSRRFVCAPQRRGAPLRRVIQGQDETQPGRGREGVEAACPWL